jgi:hypothetical protein
VRARARSPCQPPSFFSSGCEPHLSSSFASCPLQATGEPSDFEPPSPPRLSERHLRSLPDRLSSPLTFLVAFPCCRTSPEPMPITGVSWPSSNAAADSISPPSPVPRHLSKSLATPPCRAVSGKCPGRGRQDLIARDATGEPREPRHRGRSARGHSRTHTSRHRLGRPGQNGRGPGQECQARGMNRAQYCAAVFFWFFIFIYNSRKSCKVLKYVENINITLKNMKQISIESLGVYLSLRLDKSHV